ncbi:hypothetical protein KC842_01570 [Candidatus Nomurabacteria bacterium]|nr:hypothetical protein [Candidatus Nomurabacteria bacterium]USN94517.1 MAG: hypothetical protein H6791_02005 [Candidatus Nomurabacteria bacterium]
MAKQSNAIEEVSRLASIDWDEVQDYENRYSEQDHKTFAYLVKAIDEVWPGRVHPEIIKGSEKIWPEKDRIPRLSVLSKRLQEISNFRYYYSEDVTPDDVLFAGYARRMFPSTLYLRSWEERDYTPKPDNFHEGPFGHGAALSLTPFADVSQVAGLAVEQGFNFDIKVMQAMDFIHWYMVEFILNLDKHDNLWIVGPGILSSPEECIYSLESPNVRHHEIKIEKIFETFDHMLSTPKEIYHKQDDLWVIGSFKDFQKSLTVKLPEYLEKKTGAKMKKRIKL